MLIIGASGRARHGKTVTCEAIHNYNLSIGYTSKIYDIGTMILLEAVDAGRLPNGLKRAEMSREQLQVLIDIGKERRVAQPNYWIQRLLERATQEQPDVVLCPNLRLPIEAQAFRDAGGAIIRCIRYNVDGSLYISEDRPPNDITETALEFWPADFYLVNKNKADGNYPVELAAAQAITLYRYIAGKKNQ